jgi:hypothetical protein
VASKWFRNGWRGEKGESVLPHFKNTTELY